MSWPEPGDIAKLKHPFEPVQAWRERNPGVKCECGACQLERAEAALRGLFRFSERPFISVEDAQAFEDALSLARDVLGDCGRCSHPAHADFCDAGGSPSYDRCGCEPDQDFARAVSSPAKTQDTQSGQPE